MTPWNWLESHADEPEVQERIRQEILQGNIRVVPARGGGIRIIPVAPAKAAQEDTSSRSIPYAYHSTSVRS